MYIGRTADVREGSRFRGWSPSTRFDSIRFDSSRVESSALHRRRDQRWLSVPARSELFFELLTFLGISEPCAVLFDFVENKRKVSERERERERCFNSVFKKRKTLKILSRDNSENAIKRNADPISDRDDRKKGDYCEVMNRAKIWKSIEGTRNDCKVRDTFVWNLTRGYPFPVGFTAQRAFHRQLEAIEKQFPPSSQWSLFLASDRHTGTWQRGLLFYRVPRSGNGTNDLAASKK